MSEWFGDIETVWVVTIPIALLAILIIGERVRRRILDGFLGTRLVGKMVVNRSLERRRWKIVLRVVAALFVGLALMRPQWGEHQVDLVRRGIDIVFAVDTSKSMLAEDVQPNRLERVKQDIRYFVDQVVQQDRIALVGFAGTARTLCPLTLDRGAFEIFLDELDVGIIPRGGTDIEAALDEALNTFGDDERNHKAIIVFSDGEDHRGVPEDVLDDAKKRGVRIYTIGIGDPDGVRIPITDENGNKEYLKDANGDIVLTRLDDRILKTIAQRSLDGAYAHLASGRHNLEEIYLDNIKKIEERELRSRQQVRRVERYQWFLAAALALLAIDALIGEGARGARRSAPAVEPMTRGDAA